MSLLSALTYHMEKRKFSHRQLVAAVQRELLAKERLAMQMAASGDFDKILRHDKVAPPDSDFFFYISRDTNCIVWNTTSEDMPSDVMRHPETYAAGKLGKLQNGYYYLRTWRLPASDSTRTAYHALVAIPIFYDYPLENQYFQSHFAADKRIPASTSILEKLEKGAYLIRDADGSAAFYLMFRQQVEEYYVAGWLPWLLTILTCLCIVFWIHECCYGIGLRSPKPVYGFFVLMPVSYAITFLLQMFELPAGFQNSRIFSPELYSSAVGIKSFGALMINILLDSWCLVYLVGYVRMNKERIIPNKFWDWVLRIIVIGFIIFYLNIYAISAIAKMERDSKISFEAASFSSLNLYTFLGLFTVVAITINIMLLLNIANSMLHNIARKRCFPYIVAATALTTLLLWIFRAQFAWFYCFYSFLLLLSLASIYLMDKYGFPLKKRKIQYDLKIASSAYIWFAILCSWATIEVFYFNFAKEMELRKVFAYKLEQKNNGNTAFNFIGIMDELQRDSMVTAYFRHPEDATAKANITQYIDHVYLNDYYRKFNISIYFYDKYRRPILPVDTIDRVLLQYADSLNSQPFRYGLVDVEHIEEGDYIYWFLSPYLDHAQTDTAGYIGFNIYADKRFRRGSPNPFFTVRKNPTDEQYYNNYSYGVYFNTHLWTQDGSVAFPPVLKDTISKGEVVFTGNTVYSSSLLYRSSKNEVIKVVYARNVITNIISLFSYVLAILLLLSGVILVIRYVVFYPAKIKMLFRQSSLTIRAKVNATILITVLMSLFVVGFITLSFLSARYKASQHKNLQSLLLFYSQFIAHEAEEGSLHFDRLENGSHSIYSDFSYKMSQLAEEQGADVNVYNLKGELAATSQIELYKKGLLSLYMDQSVLASLNRDDASSSIRPEGLGNLNYQSLYAPIKNKYDHTVAYMNIPYYASGREFSDEMSSVIVTLVNVYTIVFFLSGLLALFISNSIIRSFRLLIDQFKNIRLHHNEYIHWPYRDEITLLVNEYNAMLKKVEIMASRLARTEREAAWRDIARQVAHEIKNPLTPMKLNIQYLQQAIASGRDDIEELAMKVSAVLIEQIENLNVIASEFSNFAKMPDATPENIPLYESFSKLIELLEKDDKAKVELLTREHTLTVYMDRNYFIRVFTNLIQNAIQAIENDKQGRITVYYEQKEHNIVITIEDNGSGIPEELRDKLFQPYFTTKSSGTGLGLPMTKSLIENSDGAIWFETSNGVGTRFFVRLPAGDREQ